MQKWIHPITKTTTSSILHYLHDFVGNILQHLSFSILQERPLLEPGCWMESDAQLVSSEFPLGVRLGSDQETYLAMESRSPCSSSEMQQCVDVYFGSLSCWKSARQLRAWSDGSIFSFNIEQYICEFIPAMKYSSPPPAALMQPHIRTLPPSCFTVGTMHFSLYS